MKILIVEDDADILELVCTMVAGIIEVDVLTASSGYEAIEIIENNSDLALIMSDFKMNNGGAIDIYRYLLDKKIKVPFGIVSTYGPKDDEIFKNFYSDHAQNFHLMKPFTFNDFEERLEKIFPKPKNLVHSDFVRISAEFIKRHALPLQIYIRLSEEKFVMIQDVGHYDGVMLDNYSQRGITDFFLKREVFETYILQTIQQTQEKLTQNTGGDILFNAIEEVQLVLSRLGVNQETIIYTETVVEEGLKSFRNYSKLCDLLDRILTMNHYVQKHAYLSAYFCVAIAKQNSDLTARDHRRLVMAALFKDICLVETPLLAEIFYAKDKKFQALSQTQQHKVMIHGQDACYILESIPEFDNITRELVLSHHERPKGNGFPRGKENKNYQTLTPYFMIGCQFSHDLITGERSLKEIVHLAQNYAFEYEFAPFKEAYDHFVTTFQSLS